MSIENEWWSKLRGGELAINAFGLPHYDVEAVADFLEPWIKPEIVLDLGCGPGRLGHVLAERHPFSTFVGYDVSPQMVSQASVGGPLNWSARLTNGADLGWTEGNGIISSAYSVTVFQHLPAFVVKGYLQQLSDILKLGGTFVFTYAIGTEDTFLSHQVTHHDMTQWVIDAGMHPVRLITPDDHPAWHWMKATKI